MISRLASPSVCVIDDEEDEYRAILDALWHLGLGCLHVRGDDSSTLPRQPFKELRVVIVDLHLAASTGKGGASHTAQIFIKLVSPDTAPAVVVIWSKYARDKVAEEGLPPEDQPTEADCFIKTLLEAEPRFKDRLIFLEMKKPMPGDRPKNKKKWVKVLQKEIQTKFGNLPAFDVLWSWEALVRDAGTAVSRELTTIASSITEEDGSHKPIHDNLTTVLRSLVKAQGESDCSKSTAPHYLVAAMEQCLTDQLEHSDNLDTLSRHGKWLSDIKRIPAKIDFAPRINGLLLTAPHSSGSGPFIPGTIYRLSDLKKFKELFGNSGREFIKQCYQNPGGEKAKTVFVEISPTCDVAQNTRRSALLIAGIITPSTDHKKVKKKSEAHLILPNFKLQWPLADFKVDTVFLMFCSRYKLTLLQNREPEWLHPWFRLRELPTASLRNWHSSHASRVGFVSLP